jgi:hypothetical protein
VDEFTEGIFRLVVAEEVGLVGEVANRVDFIYGFADFLKKVHIKYEEAYKLKALSNNQNYY